MSDDEVEAFDITNEDLKRAFNPGTRSFRGSSKNQQIYGMWADDSGDEGPSQRSGFGSSKARKQKNYSAPVSFVAGGVHQAGKNKVKENEIDVKDEEDNEETRDSDDTSESSEEDEPTVSFSNLSMGQIDGDIAGLRKKRSQFNATLANKGVGKWEQHTKGIGAKLLLQMGYQPGKGLGKDLQGIQAPIEASLRKGRGAIGAYGPEKGQKIADLETEKKKKDREEVKSDKVSQWRKEDGSSKKQKVRYVYKSIEDVIEESKQPGKKKKREFNELSKVKVIDMTGPEQRVLSGYHAISSVQKPSDQWEIRKDKKFTNFELPELQHNLNLLVEMCEEAIITNDRNLQHAENQCVALEAEVESLSQIEKKEVETIAVLDKVMDIVQKLVTGSEENTLTLQEASQAFRELQEKYYLEYCMYEISSLADTVVRPLFKDSLSAWSPLQDPKQPVEAFQQWKTILEQDHVHTLTTSSAQDPYHKLLWDTWMPCVRIAVSAWQCKKFEPMIDFLETWIPLIPGWILDNILQQLVLPRLHRDVEEWNPLTDTIPIHTWIHPWLPHLGKFLHTSIFPMIRHKLSAALVSWHPSDCSARLMLKPWVGVFNKGELDAFLINNIVPKLHLTLQDFVINPHQQHLDNWNWVMEWVELLPPHVIASLLDKSFFPKWLQVLTLWLNLNPNFDQVSNWYTGWKSMVPEPILAEPTVKEHFRSALDLMNRSVGGAPVPHAAQPDNPQAQARYQGLAECIRTSQQVPQGFKDLVQKRCEERGIVWVPLPNRYREAKQVYKCGKMQVYIDRNVLFVCNSGQWEPTSLNALLDMAV